MYQRDFDFSDDINSYKLSVVLIADSFFYGIFDHNNQLICHQTYTNLKYSQPHTLGDLVADQRLKRAYQHIVVAVLSGEMYTVDHIDVVLENTLPGLELKKPFSEKIPGQNLYNLYGITHQQSHTLDELFGHHRIKMISFPSLLAMYYLGQPQAMMHIHLEENTTYIYTQNDTKLLMYNSFETKNMQDILYFSLAVANESQLDVTLEPVIMSGWVESDSTLYKNLNSYFGKFGHIQDPTFFIHPSVTIGTKPHFYFVHFLNAICAS
jgi:hypothetical protein